MGVPTIVLSTDAKSRRVRLYPPEANGLQAHPISTDRLFKLKTNEDIMGKLNLSYKIIPFLYLENVDCLWNVFEVEDPAIDQAEKIIEWVKEHKPLALRISSIAREQENLILKFDDSLDDFFSLRKLGLDISPEVSLSAKDKILLKQGEFIPVKEISLNYIGDTGEMVAEYKKEFKIPTLTSFPSAKQVELYNSFLPAGFPSVEQHEFTIYYLRVADNLINRGLGRWTEPDLQKICKKLPGIPVTLDHDWENNNKSHSIVIDSKMEFISPDEVVSCQWLTEKMDTKGLLNENQKIIEKEGFISAIAEVAIPSISSPTIQKIRFGLLNSVSLGGFEFTDIGCPICNTSFLDRKKCSHRIPTDETLGEENVAPYYNRLNLIDLGEVSFVLIPNLPVAGIVQKRSLQH